MGLGGIYVADRVHEGFEEMNAFPLSKPRTFYVEALKLGNFSLKASKRYNIDYRKLQLYRSDRPLAPAPSREIALLFSNLQRKQERDSIEVLCDNGEILPLIESMLDVYVSPILIES